MEKEITPIALKNGIFVVGHPRSGTSLACQLVESAGVKFLSDMNPDVYNKEGYFELSSAKELEKKLLDEAMTNRNIQEMNQVVKQLNEGQGLTGLKIVHIPSVFYYRHIAKNIRIIAVYRNPADVLSSMYRRGISQFKLDWVDNNNALIATYENIPKTIVISYESLIEKKEGVKKAFRKLGLNINMDVINEGHRTQKNSQIVVPPDAVKVYKTLQKIEKKCMS